MPIRRNGQIKWKTLYREAFSNPNVDGILMWGFWQAPNGAGPTQAWSTWIGPSMPTASGLKT